MAYVLVLIVVLASLASCGAAPAPVSQPASQPGCLTATTFNLRVDTPDDGADRWDLRKDLLVATIRTLGPDVLGTQESLPQQTRYLDAELADYTRIGVGRDDGKDGGEACCLYLRKSRFDVLASGAFWLSPTPDVPGVKGWDAAYVRVAVWARVTDKALGRPMVFLDTHMDNAGKEARRQSALLVRRWLAEHAGQDPIVFLGDFNSTEKMEAYQTLADPAAQPVLRDAYRCLHPLHEPGEGTFHGFKGRTDWARIDYVFCSAHFTPVAAEITHTSRDGHYPSDHFPFTAVLAPAKP